MRLIRALRDCKQRSLTVSKKAPTVSKNAPTVSKKASTPEKYPKNTNFVFFEFQGGFVRRYFEESLFCMLRGIFAFLGLPIL